MARSGEESCSQSSIGLESVSYSTYIPHPQSWTVVPEYNMALRQQNTHEPFSNWKYDVKCQIANISQKLQESLDEHPDTRARGAEIPWRPTHSDRTGRADRDLPLHEQRKRPFTSNGAPPPSREQTETFYRENSTADPKYALSFGLGKKMITR